MSECILSTKNIFTIIEPEGGYIPFVFTRDMQGVHQIVGPTWEFVVGLSDISSWKTDLGLRNDENQILGAFQDQFNDWNRYNVSLQENKVILLNDIMTMRKSISVFVDSIHFDIQTSNQLTGYSVIPLVVDPWHRYTPGWGNSYTGNNASNNFIWGINGGERVEIRTTNPIDVYSFNDTHTAMYRPEDPNFDYSPGHYLPFPLSVVYITPSENYSLDIIINP